LPADLQFVSSSIKAICVGGVLPITGTLETV
jgi:hypothetical protein